MGFKYTEAPETPMVPNLAHVSFREELWTHPEYFKVSFIGSSYPLFVRNKEFIYRGLDYEKMEDFTQRLCQEFPEAKLFTKVDL